MTTVASTRASVRFPLKLPVTVRTADSREHFAETQDISSGGVLFYMNTALAPETAIHFRIVMPSGVLGTETDVLVNCIGRVIRCQETIRGKKAVAVVIDEYCFERVYCHAG
ncbi:MAG TPA: PilZ domain-containing protein [Candidatus Angelobacter sp.]|nr:PilZ domain-containing protein [Candidatus Angelobacter sp.]